jgi:hypothetical protein
MRILTQKRRMLEAFKPKAVREVGRRLWVKTGKAQNEHMLSGLPPVADLDADMLERQRGAKAEVDRCRRSAASTFVT